MSKSGSIFTATTQEIPIIPADAVAPVGEPVGVRPVEELLKSWEFGLEEPKPTPPRSPIFIPKIGDLVDWNAGSEDLLLLETFYGKGPFTVEKLYYDRMVGYMVYLSKVIGEITITTAKETVITGGKAMVFSRALFMANSAGNGWREANPEDTREYACLLPRPEDCFLVKFFRKV